MKLKLKLKLKLIGKLIGLFIFPLLFSSPAWSFPEMVRHGYANCLTCHTSPSGGGLLTAYGRALSKETMSAFPKDQGPKEEEFLWGKAPTPSWLTLGGDVRFLQFFRDTPTASSAKAILMQMDVEAMVEAHPRLRVQGTFGRQEPRAKATSSKDYMISRRHWINILLGPEKNLTEHQVRWGRFLPSYGMNIPEHTAVTRRSLGFDQNQETYNLEYFYTGPQWNTAFTHIFGRTGDGAPPPKETGWAAQLQYAPVPTKKFGTNFASKWADQAPSNKRKYFMGGHALLGWTPELYTLVEFDWTYSRAVRWGFFELIKFGWEFRKGIHLQAYQEFGQNSSLNSQLTYEAYSLGLQFFPRTHWEVTALVREEKNKALFPQFTRAAWILLHYYL